MHKHAAALVLATVSVYWESTRAQLGGSDQFNVDAGNTGHDPFLVPESIASDTDPLAGHTTYNLIVKTKKDWITSIYGVRCAASC